MEQSNKGQNSVIFSIAEILGKMSNQVNFLIRHDKLLSQLDVDMLMENTRKLYDTICSVNCNMDVDSIPMEIENEEELGMKEEVEEVEDVEIEEEVEDEDVEDVEDVEEEIKDVKEIEFKMDFEIDDDIDSDDDIDDDDDDDDDDDYIPSPVPDSQKPDSLLPEEEDSGIRSYIKTPSHDSEIRTISDKLEQHSDNSLASVLQKKSIADLMTAIDLNDRFMFLNELFDSNMEKYNKSIRALNSFSTLLGAKTYMSELQIEYQWDCESDAYQKLNDLVERRFMSIHNS